MDKHHIVPRYAGGSDRSDNLIAINRTCHIMWHFANWQLWGNKQDYIAYKGLAGALSKEELNREKSSLAGLKAKLKRLGLFSLSKKERYEASQKGGSKGGKVMTDYKWITNGVENSRIPKHLNVPCGWRYGVTRKKPAKLKLNKFDSRKSWNEKQKEIGKTLMKERLKDLEKNRY